MTGLSWEFMHSTDTKQASLDSLYGAFMLSIRGGWIYPIIDGIDTSALGSMTNV